MAQKTLPTVLKKQGKRVVRYRETVRGRSFNGELTARASGTQGTAKVWYGGTKVSKAGKNVVSTTQHASDVFFFVTGH